VTLTDEQVAAVDRVIELIHHQQLTTLGGYAGTGKTTITRHLYDTLKDYGVCAYTGKAADILRRKGLPASTIHSTIYRPIHEGKGVRFELKGKSELGVQGFLVDEASMVGTKLFDDMLSFDLPIVAVGDHGQLPPVGEDAGLMRCPDVCLEQVHRNAGPIARFAEHLRLGGAAGEWDGVTQSNEGAGIVHVTGTHRVTNEHLQRADQVICAFNSTRVQLNRSIRMLLGKPSGNTPAVGDRVMCLRNDRSVGVFNGQQGTITTIGARRQEMTFQPLFGVPVVVHYHKDGWNAPKAPQYDRNSKPGQDVPFDFAYCVTAHKFQGDESNKVIVYEERCDLWDHARWAYTAASRAKETLLWATKN